MPIFFIVWRHCSTALRAGTPPTSYSTMYHLVLPMVSESSKISFHGRSSSPMTAFGFVFDQGLTWIVSARPGYFYTYST